MTILNKDAFCSDDIRENPRRQVPECIGKMRIAVENRIRVNITVFKPDVSNIKMDYYFASILIMNTEFSRLSEKYRSGF